jgi:hypothetical protein
MMRFKTSGLAKSKQRLDDAYTPQELGKNWESIQSEDDTIIDTDIESDTEYVIIIL